MKLVTRAYGKDSLPDLRLTDVTISSPLSWPESLWWLSLERCHITAHLRLPPGLLKATLVDCTGLEYVTFPSSLKSIKFQSVDLQEPRFPVNVDTLVVQECIIKNLLFISSSLKHLKIKQCVIDNNIASAVGRVAASLPHLKSLSITGVDLSPDAFINFFLNLEAKNPQLRLHVESVYALEDDETAIIKSLVRSSRLPTTIKFGDAVINIAVNNCPFG